MLHLKPCLRSFVLRTESLKLPPGKEKHSFRRVQLWADQQTHTAHIHLAIGTTGHHQKITSPTTLLPNTLLVWDAQLWTLVNLGETTTTLLPEVGQPMQLPTAFFLQLFDSGTITRPN